MVFPHVPPSCCACRIHCHAWCGPVSPPCSTPPSHRLSQDRHHCHGFVGIDPFRCTPGFSGHHQCNRGKCQLLPKTTLPIDNFLMHHLPNFHHSLILATSLSAAERHDTVNMGHHPRAFVLTDRASVDMRFVEASIGSSFEADFQGWELLFRPSRMNVPDSQSFPQTEK